MSTCILLFIPTNKKGGACIKYNVNNDHKAEKLFCYHRCVHVNKSRQVSTPSFSKLIVRHIQVFYTVKQHMAMQDFR